MFTMRGGPRAAVSEAMANTLWRNSPGKQCGNAGVGRKRNKRYRVAISVSSSIRGETRAAADKRKAPASEGGSYNCKRGHLKVSAT